MVLLWYLYSIYIVFKWYLLPTKDEETKKAESPFYYHMTI